MSQPHHHVYNALQQAIIKTVKIEGVLQHLIDKKVIPEAHRERYEKNPTNGMKILIAYLRNQSFDTFLDFVECIFLAQKEVPSKVQSVPVVESMVKAVQDFDQRNNSTHAENIIAIQEKYMQQQFPTVEVLSERPQSATSLSLLPHEAVAKAEEEESSEYEDLPSPLQEPPVRKGPGMPDLDYIEDPTQTTFQSDGGEINLDDYGFSLVVQSQAIPEDQEVTVTVGMCCYGPFSIGENYMLASDFVVIVADTDAKFRKPVKIVMEHCLILPEYRKCSEVVILRANHLKVTEDNLYTFDRFTNPDLSPDWNQLSFETENFCILCAALYEGERGRSSSSSSSASVSRLMSQTHIDDDNPSSAPSSFDEDNNYQMGLERSISAESKPEVERVLSTSSESALDLTGSHISPQKRSYNLRKRNSGSMESRSGSTSPQKRLTGLRKMAVKRSLELSSGGGGGGGGSCAEKKPRSGVEYAALLFQPKSECIDIERNLYRFVVFICTNCGVAHKMCWKDAEEMLGTEVTVTFVPITFEKALKLNASKPFGWTMITDKPSTVGIADVQFHTLKSVDLFERLKQKTCPPRVLFTASYGEEDVRPKFSSTIRIEGATTRETHEEVFFSIMAFPPKQQQQQQQQFAANIYRQNAFDQSIFPYPPHPYPYGGPAQYQPAQYQPAQYQPTQFQPVRYGAYPSQMPLRMPPQQMHSQENVPPPPPAPPHESLRSQVYPPPPPTTNLSFSDSYGSQPLGQPQLSQAQYSQSPEAHEPAPWHSRGSEFAVPRPIARQVHASHGDSEEQVSPVLSQRSLNLQQLSFDRSLSQETHIVLPAQSPVAEIILRSGSSGLLRVCSTDDEMERDRASSHKSIDYYDSQMSPEQKNRPFTRKDYLMINPHLKSWKKVAREGFGLTDARVTQLEFNHHDDFQEASVQAYVLWRKESANLSVTFREMLDILYKAGQFEAIDSLIGIAIA